MPDRKDRTVNERIEDHGFDDPKVRAYLDTLDLEQLRWKLGEPRIVKVYAEPLGWWHVGDGRPSLADDYPAVMQAIGRCAASRREYGPVTGAIHPVACGWCDYPAEQLLAACDWATWHSRFLITELWVWSDPEASWVSYEREARSNEYEQPRWREFFAIQPRERRQRIEAAT